MLLCESPIVRNKHNKRGSNDNLVIFVSHSLCEIRRLNANRSINESQRLIANRVPNENHINVVHQDLYENSENQNKCVNRQPFVDHKTNVNYIVMINI